MNEPHAIVHYPRPPWPIRILVNALVTAILRSRWHRLRSDRLLLLTFVGRKSGAAFTTPVFYAQEGETLRVTILYPWWKNLVGGAAVRVLLRGQMRSGVAEVSSEEGGGAVVRVHLRG